VDFIHFCECCYASCPVASIRAIMIVWLLGGCIYKGTTSFLTITLAVLCRFLQFLHQWTQEWILYKHMKFTWVVTLFLVLNLISRLITSAVTWTSNTLLSSHACSGVLIIKFCACLINLITCNWHQIRHPIRTTVNFWWPGIQCCRPTNMEQPTGSRHLGRNSDNLSSQT